MLDLWVVRYTAAFAEGLVAFVDAACTCRCRGVRKRQGTCAIPDRVHAFEMYPALLLTFLLRFFIATARPATAESFYLMYVDCPFHR